MALRFIKKWDGKFQQPIKKLINTLKRNLAESLITKDDLFDDDHQLSKLIGQNTIPYSKAISASSIVSSFDSC